MNTPNAANADQDRPAARPDGKLPLVIEIKPGQAKEGLVGVFKPEQYAGKSIDELVRATLESPNLNDTERKLVTDIKQNMNDGKLLYRGQEASGKVSDYKLATEETGLGEKILYLELNAIKPQEGGVNYRY